MTSVCLKWNHVGSHERGVQALCDMLKDNMSITHLDLRNNKIGGECAHHIGEMIRENHTLTHLDLSWNDLGVEGGKALLTGIQANHTLVDCQLSGNRIAEDTLHAIAFVLRRNRQTAPLGAAGTSAGLQVPRLNAPSAEATGNLPNFSKDTKSPTSSKAMDVAREVAAGAGGGRGLGPPGSPGSPGSPGATNGWGDGSRPVRSLQGTGALALSGPVVQDEGLSLKLLQREQNNSNAEDARFFGEVAEYIDLLQLDVARNRKYRGDAEERERVVTKGFMEREMRYAQEMRELENLLAKAKAEKDELVHDTQYLQTEIDRVREEKAKTLQDRMRLEEIARATAERLRCDIRDALTVKADLETQIYKVKRRQQEHEEENARLRTYLSKCKEDLDRALR